MKHKPLKILFDANPLVLSNKSGVGFYTEGLIKALSQNFPDEIELVGHYFNFLGRKSSNIKYLPQGTNISYVETRYIPGKILSVTRPFGFQPPMELFYKQRGDVALFPNFVSLPSIYKIPKCIVVHDLCYLDMPEYVSKKNRDFLRRFVPRSIKSAALVVTISEFTKKSIIQKYKSSNKDFLITPIPPEKPDLNASADLASIGLSGKYILNVGTLEPRKNIGNLVKAYELLPKKFQNGYSLVLAGGFGWYIEETLAEIRELQKKGVKIITPGYISDEMRSTLYKNASVFVFPSHYEGFGMPILEAMTYGVPTAVSQLDVFQEIAGDATYYFDKDDPNSISSAIQEILSEPSKKNRLINRGYKKVKSYDWNRVARSIYESMPQDKS